MDIIYTDADKADIGIVQAGLLDLAIGDDENDFELTTPLEAYEISGGSYIYIQGTEYGGIVDGLTLDSDSENMVASGRTWHGILESKVICPDSGEDYYTVSGDANEILSTLIERLDLGDTFTASTEDSGITISSYSFPRYVKAYTGINNMLLKQDAKLKIAYDGYTVNISAEKCGDYSDMYGADQFEFKIDKEYHAVNHLIALGKGELKDRLVLHIYADSDGTISQTQTQFGLDEVSDIYEYSSIEDSEELLSEATEKLGEMQSEDEAEINFSVTTEGYDIGDIVSLTSDRLGLTVSEKISKKILKISSGTESFEYKIGSTSATATAYA